MTRRAWQWPTSEGWIYMLFFVLLAYIAGGFSGALVMIGFLATVNVLGNLLLP